MLKLETFIKNLNRNSLIKALLSTALVALTLTFVFVGAPFELILSTFFLVVLVVSVLLFQLYRVTRRSKHTRKLTTARVHIFLHFVPLVFFVAHILGTTSFWIQFTQIVLFVSFFASGRKTWKILGDLSPSANLYKYFYQGNSAFLTSFPILFLASFVFPQWVDFKFIDKLATFYFSIHFMILGVTCLKIESDLKAKGTDTL